MAAVTPSVVAVASVAGSAGAAASAEAADPAAAVADSVRPESHRLDLLGVPLDAVTRPEIEQRLAEQLGCPDANLLHVITLNPEYVIACQRDEQVRDAVSGAELSVPDGVGVVLATRWLHDRPVERLTGVDLSSWLLSNPEFEHARLFLLGTAGSVAELHGRHPTRVVGRWGAGSPDARDDAKSIARIRERRANVVLVGYGAPAQVLWIERNRAALAEAGVLIAIGVGGALDYLAGTVPRAPEPIRAVGLEWAYRLLREPWRWRRQLALPRFALLVAQARFERRASVR